MVSEKSLGKIKIAISEPCKYYVYSYCKQSNVTIDVLWHFLVFQFFLQTKLVENAIKCQSTYIATFGCLQYKYQACNSCPL